MRRARQVPPETKATTLGSRGHSAQKLAAGAPAARACLRLLMVLQVLAGCDKAGAPAPSPSATAKGSASTKAAKFAFPFRDPSLPVLARAEDIVQRLTPQEKIRQLVHNAPAIERLSIPSYNWWNEALHGVARSGRATVFPQAIALAATFDTKLLKTIANAISDEARAKFNRARKLGNRSQYAGLSYWSPNINIFRDPRWGRGQETYGEDPYLTSRMAVAFVKGMQGDHPKFLKTAACAKHFAVHSGPEALRHEFDVAPSKKDLFETYLPAFEAVVTEAKVEAVMTAYNRLYGEPCSSSKFLIQDLLREKWQFQGHVLSDCWALVDIHARHEVTTQPSESAARALRAGLDLNCGNTYPELGTALDNGLVNQKMIDEALTRLFVTRIKLGLFDPRGSVPFDHVPPEVVGQREHLELSKVAATEAIVLLKNRNNTLPLDPKIKSLMLLGPYVADGHVLLGNYFGGASELSTLYEGIMSAVDAGASVEYKHAFLAGRENLNPIDWTTGAAHQHDAIIVTLGLSSRMEGEEGAANESEHRGDRAELELPQHQIEYLRKLRSAGDKKIIVVLFGGSALAIKEVHELADAILLAWYPGQMGGAALADIIFGHSAPSGRLPLTFPESTADLPAFEDYGMQGRTYRYSQATPLYPFGFGLSYGHIEYESLNVVNKNLKPGADQTVIVRLTNKSSRRLQEVVQLYLTDLEASAPVPLMSLAAFSRVTLEPGRARSVEMKISSQALQLVTDTGDRIYEPGRFRVWAGGSLPSKRAVDLGAPEPLSVEFELSK